MAYVLVSLPKQSGGAGAPAAKSPYIILVPTSSIETFPNLSHDTVIMRENIVLKTTNKGVKIYVTPTTLKRKDVLEGDADAKGYKSELEAEHPGDSAEVNSFIQQYANEGFVAISSTHTSDGCRVQGTPSNPLYFTGDEQDDNEGRKKMIKLSQSQRDAFKMAHYYGLVPAVADDSDYAPIVPPPTEASL